MKEDEQFFLSVVRANELAGEMLGMFTTNYTASALCPSLFTV